MPQRSHRSHPLLHVIGYSIIALALILTLLPQIVGQGLRYALTRYGAGAVEVENVDINLFTGSFAIDGLQLYRSAAQLMHIGHAELELDWRGLLQRHVVIRRLSLDNVSITVEQGSQSPLRIAGFPVPPAESEGGTADNTRTGWGIGIDELSINRSAIQLIRPGLTQTLRIENLTLGAAQSWQANQQTSLKAEFGLNDSRLLLNATARPFSPSPDATVTLQLEELELTLAQALMPDTDTLLSGRLTANLELSLQQRPEGFSLEQRGELSLTQPRFKHPQLSLQGERIAWQGEGRLKLSEQHSSASLNGNVSGRQLSLQLPTNALRLSLGALDWVGQLEFGDLSTPASLSSTGSLSLQTLAAARTSVPQPHTQLSSLRLQQVELSGTRDIRIEAVQLAGLQGQLTLTQQGLEPISFHHSSGNSAGGEKSSQNDSEPGVGLRINTIEMSGNNRLLFEDRTVKPVFTQKLSPESLRIGIIDTRMPSSKTPFNLEAAIGEHSRLSVNGEGTPLSSPPGFSLQASLQDYEMPPLTSYLITQIGYRINSGQLDSGLTLEITDNTMQGELKLKARQLELQPEDPARIEEFEKKSNMPVNTALSLLRDSDNNIALTIPLSGRLDDPRFDLSDAFNTALAKTMRSATVSYLKYLLQPYSSVITLVQLAGKAGGGIRLEPVHFEPGSAAVNDTMQTYSEKLAELVHKESKLQLRLCGFATVADKRALDGDKADTIAEEGDPRLETLARERAEALKRLLVEEYGIPPGQLFICHPSLDRGPEASPRVELQL